MKNYLKNIFAITDQGANDLIGASTTSFFVYVVNMLPAILLMMIMNKFIFGVSASNTFYFIASVLLTIGISSISCSCSIRCSICLRNFQVQQKK